VIHLPKKRTIIKDRVGCVKTSTYDLPKDGFSYGRKSVEGVEGAGDSKYCVDFLFLLLIMSVFLVISNWVTANPSLEKKSAKQVVFSNVLAIKRGYFLCLLSFLLLFC